MRRAGFVLAAMILAGCAGSGAPSGPASTDARPPPLYDVPVLFQGHVAAGVRHCGVAGPCQSQDVGPENATLPLNVSGRLVRLNLTMTWVAASPGTQQMRIGLRYTIGAKTSTVYHDGVSPLAFRVADLNLPVVAEAALYGDAAFCAPLSESLCATQPQDFFIQGNVTFAR